LTEGTPFYDYTFVFIDCILLIIDFAVVFP
jgi:hypothetical protein